MRQGLREEGLQLRLAFAAPASSPSSCFGLVAPVHAEGVLDKAKQTIGLAMYRPHAAREDTDLFPKLRSIVSAHEFSSIGEDMEKQEKQKFGEDGFEKAVAHVAGLEKSIGIADLKQFTPAG